MLTDDTLDIYRKLEKRFEDANLHRPMRIERYEAGTELEYDVEAVVPKVAGRVRLVVYNILGQLVKVLVDGDQAAGPHTVVWDGRDNAGGEISSGVYFYRVRAGDFSATRKMVLVR